MDPTCTTSHASLNTDRGLRHGITCLALALGCLAWGRPAAAQAVYQYTGNPFTLFSCGPSVPGPGDVLCSTPAPTNPDTSYTATDRVTATLTLDSPLPANLAYQDVRTLAGFQLSMNDGEHTVTNADAAGGMYAEVSTDASGNLLNWRLVLNTGGVENGGIATINVTDASGTHVFDQGVLACCSPTILGNLAMNFTSPGTWTGGDSTPSPADLTSNLINLVSNPLLGLTSGQTNSLTDKLNNALASIDAGLNKQAINQLNSFVNAVNTYLKNGKISAQTANTLITAADAIIASL